jgi:hypothetical protein
VCESSLLRLESRENFVSPLGVSVLVLLHECRCHGEDRVGERSCVCVCYHLLPFSNFVMSTFTTEEECCCAHAVHANHYFLSNSCDNNIES